MPTIKKGRTNSPEVHFNEIEIQILIFTHKFGLLANKTLLLELDYLGLSIDEATLRSVIDDLIRYFNRPIVGCAQSAKERGII